MTTHLDHHEAGGVSEPSPLPRSAAIALRITLATMAGAVLAMVGATYAWKSTPSVLGGMALLGGAGLASGLVILVHWKRVDWLMRLACAGFIGSGLLVLNLVAKLAAR
jgi:hypothetical protein